MVYWEAELRRCYRNLTIEKIGKLNIYVTDLLWIFSSLIGHTIPQRTWGSLKKVIKYTYKLKNKARKIEK